MKLKKIELDVDYIGGQSPLTIDEEKALSVFFKGRKIMPTSKKSIKKQIANNKKVLSQIN